MSLTQNPAITWPSVVTIDWVITAFDAPEADTGIVLPVWARTRTPISDLTQKWSARSNTILSKDALSERINTLNAMSIALLTPDMIRRWFERIWASLSDDEYTSMNMRLLQPTDMNWLWDASTRYTVSTENNLKPIVPIFPNNIMIDGEASPLNLQTIIEKFWTQDANHKGVILSDLARKEVHLNRTFWDTLRLYAADVLKWSINKNYQKQLQGRSDLNTEWKNYFGELDATEMLIVAWLYHICHPTSETLMRQNVMRTDTLGGGRGPRYYGSDDSDLGLNVWYQGADPDVGLGSSSKIPLVS
jgi:hypothetical protein